MVQWLLGLTTIQLVFGALMAGHKAATAAPTWPDINGSYFPESLFKHVPFMLNFIDNTITVHFIHRNLAYLLLLITIWATIKMYRQTQTSKTFNKYKKLPLLLVGVQVLLGIFSLIASPGIEPNRWGAFEWMAQLHQIGGMLFALSLISLLYLVRRR